MNIPFIDALKLRGRLTWYVTLLAVVPLVAFSWLGMNTTERVLNEQVHEMLRVEAEGLRDLVEASLVERETSVRGWAEDALVREALLTGNAERSDEVLTRLQLRYTTFTGLVLFTDEGRAISASTPALRDSFASQADKVRQKQWFQEAQHGRFTSQTLTEEDPVFGMRVLHLATPVVDPRDGRRLGVLLAAYDWDQVRNVVKAALVRARARKNNSFALEVRTASGTVLYDSHEQGARRVTNAVTEEAINNEDMADVGDGWHFVALSDPAEVYATVNRLRAVFLVSIASVTALVVVLTLLFARRICAPITRLNEAVSLIVRTGDLTQKPDVYSNDEVGELAESFRRMVDKLSETTSSLQHGTRVLTDTVAALNRAAEQEESNLTRQAAALQQTQVTAEEIKQTAMLAAERAGAVLQVASRAEQLGQDGAQALLESMGGIESLRQQVDEMAGQISQLNERARRIGGITQTVKDLADQSNMLALNAAIEAVRSGEHGKGFAVVAKEIRILANQSISSTSQVGTLLKDITGSIQKTVKLSEAGQKRMDAGLAQARTSAENIHALSTIVKDNMNAVRQISTAVNQQNAGFAEIFNAMAELSGMMTETMTSMQATQQVAVELREVAEQMQKVARSYRV
jgi:methyl-accepting chemotaxis protein